MPDHYLDKARNCGRITKAYDQQTVDQMRADLRAIDAEVVYWTSQSRSSNTYVRYNGQVALRTWKAKQLALAAKVARIEAAREQG